MDEYIKQLKLQGANIKKGSLRLYFTKVYRIVSEELNSRMSILEVGAGGGYSKEFLTEFSILRTDLLEFPENDVVGGVDLQRLPFSENEFDACFAIDVIHHVENPINSLKEIMRIVDFENDGRIILCEPYTSIFSYPIFKKFHFEQTSNPWTTKFSQLKLNSAPSNGDQSVARLLFQEESGRLLISEIFPDSDYSIKIRLFSFIDFFATGGLTRAFPLPVPIMQLLMLFENTIPQWALKYLASRCIITIAKRN